MVFCPPPTNANENVCTMGCKGSYESTNICISAPVLELSNLPRLQNGYWYFLIYYYEHEYEKIFECLLNDAPSK